MKIITKYAMLLCFLSSAMLSFGQSFEETEDFDDASHFETSAAAPVGWTSTGNKALKRTYINSDYGFAAASGSYCLLTYLDASTTFSNEVITTKAYSLKGGKKCSVSFALYAYSSNPNQVNVRIAGMTVKAGTSQDPSTHTIEVGTMTAAAHNWDTITLEFTPEADGDYYFSFIPYSGNTLGLNGYFGLEDVTIMGTAPGGTDPDPEPEPGTDPEPEIEIGEPDPDNEANAYDLPYIESFDNENNNYDGKSYVPVGWLSTGTMPFVTAQLAGVEAVTGTYYAIADDVNYERDERLYTPFFVLNAGTTYNIAFYVYMPGKSAPAQLDFTVGTQQDYEFHAVMKSISGYYKGWTKTQLTFTPKLTGPYCFSFFIGNSPVGAGVVAIDDFSITTDGLSLRPTASFGVDAVTDVYDSSVVTTPKYSVGIINTSKYASEYLWEVPGATPETSTERNPRFTFPQTGTYTITLTTSNSVGEKTTSRDVAVSVMTTAHEDYPLWTYNCQEDRIMQSSSELPVFNTGDQYDYVTGPNYYYRSFAQRVNVPGNMAVTIKSLTWSMQYLHIKQDTHNADYACPLNIVIYGEKDGRPDLNNVFGRAESTVSEVLGSMGFEIRQSKAFTFPTPITAVGPFYIAFELDDRFPITCNDPNLVRNYYAFAPLRHATNWSSLFCRPNRAPEGTDIATDGSWVAVDLLDRSLAGLGLYMAVWGDIAIEDRSSVALTTDGEIMYAAMFDGDTLIVSGTTAGQSVTVYDLAGHALLTAPAAELSTTIDAAPLAHGIYIVACGEQATKVAK